MSGIQLIRLLDDVRVTSIRNAIGVSPRSIIIQGEDFRSVEQVIVDGFVSPFFVAHTPTEMIAEVPEPLRESTINSVSVLSSSLTMTDRSLVEFTLGTRIKKVTGSLKLMQTFLRILLRTPGSNKFSPRSGGGMLSLISGNIGKQTAADIAVAIQTARQYLINVQTSDRSIPPSERLLSAEIQSINADPHSASAYVTIVLTSHAGSRGAATLTT
jgi:hypothetical protein